MDSRRPLHYDIISLTLSPARPLGCEPLHHSSATCVTRRLCTHRAALNNRQIDGSCSITTQRSEMEGTNEEDGATKEDRKWTSRTEDKTQKNKQKQIMRRETNNDKNNHDNTHKKGITNY